MTILHSGNAFGSIGACGPVMCSCEMGGDCWWENPCPSEQAPCRPDDPIPCNDVGTPPCDPNMDCFLEVW